jgi:hypothetical protein
MSSPKPSAYGKQTYKHCQYNDEHEHDSIAHLPPCRATIKVVSKSKNGGQYLVQMFAIL